MLLVQTARVLGLLCSCCCLQVAADVHDCAFAPLHEPHLTSSSYIVRLHRDTVHLLSLPSTMGNAMFAAEDCICSSWSWVACCSVLPSCCLLLCIKSAWYCQPHHVNIRPVYALHCCVSTKAAVRCVLQPQATSQHADAVHLGAVCSEDRGFRTGV